MYSLYVHIAYTEWQVINFPGGETSINHVVDRTQLLTFMLGYLSGHDAAKRAEAER